MIKFRWLNKIWVLPITAIFLFFTVVVYAQQTIPSSFQKYGLSFPIKELGNCNSVSECISFCDDPVNHDTCVNFAKNKGFYDIKLHQQQAVALANAKAELGCDTLESCKTLCQKAESGQKCAYFAQKYLLTKKINDSKQQLILSQAKQSLGCDSFDSCTKFCSEPLNQQKCSQFAQDNGLKGGTMKQGPGGCQSEASCKVFCSMPANFETCANFMKSQNQQLQKNNFHGPGGCDSELSCRAYCNDHPKECNFSNNSDFNRGSPDLLQPRRIQNPETYCKNTPGCNWTGKTCQCNNFPGSSSIPDSQKPISNTTSSFPPFVGGFIDCVGADGKHFQASQSDCGKYNQTWKNFSPTPTSTPPPSPVTSTNTNPHPAPSSCDLPCQQSMCLRCGGTWTNNICSNAKPC